MTLNQVYKQIAKPRTSEYVSVLHLYCSTNFVVMHRSVPLSSHPAVNIRNIMVKILIERALSSRTIRYCTSSGVLKPGPMLLSMPRLLWHHLANGTDKRDGRIHLKPASSPKTF